MGKKLIVVLLALCFVVFSGCNTSAPSESPLDPSPASLPDSSAGNDTASPPAETPPDQETGGPWDMTLESSGIVNGVIADKYGGRGDIKNNGIPVLSIPLSIKWEPDDTVCFAIRMMDPDSVPLCGYEWVHWLAANIETTDIPENASIELKPGMVQGLNEFGAIGYGGPTPPDKPHTYIITVYALDTTLDLLDEFVGDELDAAISGHILAEAQTTGSYTP